MRVAEISVSGGDPFPIPVPSEGLTPLSVSPDGSELLAIDMPGNLWSLPTLGGSPHRLANTFALDPFGTDAAWSPDGKMLAYCNRNDLFLARSDGTEARKLVSVPGRLYAPQFSPDETKLRFSVDDPINGGHALWEISVQGTNLHPLLPGLHTPPDEDEGKWTPDGKYFVFESKGQIWGLPEKTGFFRRSMGTPFQLTDSPLNLAFAPSQQRRHETLRGRPEVVGRIGALRREVRRVSALSLRNFSGKCRIFEGWPIGWRTSPIPTASCGEPRWTGASV